MQSKKSMNGISGISCVHRARPPPPDDLLPHELQRDVVQQAPAGDGDRLMKTAEGFFRHRSSVHREGHVEGRDLLGLAAAVERRAWARRSRR